MRELKKLVIVGLLSLLAIGVLFAKVNAEKTNTTKPGDIDLDGDVDIFDIVLAASQYKLHPNDPCYNATIVERADIAAPRDGIINIFDLTTIIYYYGK